jgi:hypothetical protein
MTSANVVEYSIQKNGEQVGHHRENVMCKSHYEELLKFLPLEEHTITPYGYDEEEEEWEDEPINLKKFLQRVRLTSKVLNEELTKIENGLS